MFYVAISPSVCLFACLYVCNTITFETFNTESSFWSAGNIFIKYGQVHNIKVIESRSKSHQRKAREIPDSALSNFSRQYVWFCRRQGRKFACSMGVSATAAVDRMVWPPSLSRDRKHTYPRAVCLRLEGSLVWIVLLWTLFCVHLYANNSLPHYLIALWYSVCLSYFPLT